MGVASASRPMLALEATHSHSSGIARTHRIRSRTLSGVLMSQSDSEQFLKASSIIQHFEQLKKRAQQSDVTVFRLFPLQIKAQKTPSHHPNRGSPGPSPLILLVLPVFRSLRRF